MAALAASLEYNNAKMECDKSHENFDIDHYFAKILSELPENLLIELQGNLSLLKNSYYWLFISCIQ